MGNFSFKSVGRTRDTIIEETTTTSDPPIGIKTPLRLGKNSLYEMHTSLADQVVDNFRNLLLTNWGERLGKFDCGANLRPLMSDLASSEDFDAEAIKRISSAVQKWMPYIDLDDFESTIDKNETKGMCTTRLRITFGIPSLGVKKRVIELTLNAI